MANSGGRLTCPSMCMPGWQAKLNWPTEAFMDPRPKVLAFAGSARKQSLNKRLVQVAAEGARRAGAEVTLIDLKDYPLPLYDGDLEAGEGLPQNARRLRELMLGHDGFLISSPEYNGSLSPLLKNVIDWCSRSVDGQDGL